MKINHTQRTALWNAPVTSPRLTKASSKLFATSDMGMVFKLRMTKPGRQTQTAKHTIPNLPYHPYQKTCRRQLQRRTFHSTSKDLLCVKSSRIPKFHRAPTVPSTKDRNLGPGLKPAIKLLHTGRSPDPVSHRKNTQRTLTKRGESPPTLGIKAKNASNDP